MITFKQYLKENTQELKLTKFNREPNRHGYTDHFEFSMGKKGFASLENREKDSDWLSALAVFDLNLPDRSGMIYQFTNPLPSSASNSPQYGSVYEFARSSASITRWLLGQPAHYTVKKQIPEYTEYIKTIIDFMESFNLKKREFYLSDLDKETKDTWEEIVPNL